MLCEQGNKSLPDMATSYHTNGLVLFDMGDLLAVEHFQSALAMGESVLGANHVDSLLEVSNS